MEYKAVTYNDGKAVFLLDTANTRSGFKHVCTMKFNGIDFDAKCCYYNRTWECFRYQTVMLKAIEKAKDDYEKRLKKSIKEDTWGKDIYPTYIKELEEIRNKVELGDIAEEG